MGRTSCRASNDSTFSFGWPAMRFRVWQRAVAPGPASAARVGRHGLGSEPAVVGRRRRTVARSNDAQQRHAVVGQRPTRAGDRGPARFGPQCRQLGRVRFQSVSVGAPLSNASTAAWSRSVGPFSSSNSVKLAI